MGYATFWTICLQTHLVTLVQISNKCYCALYREGWGELFFCLEIELTFHYIKKLFPHTYMHTNTHMHLRMIYKKNVIFWKQNWFQN
jgi:hypothetical protein